MILQKAICNQKLKGYLLRAQLTIKRLFCTNKVSVSEWKNYNFEMGTLDNVI